MAIETAVTNFTLFLALLKVSSVDLGHRLHGNAHLSSQREMAIETAVTNFALFLALLKVSSLFI